MAKRGVGAAHEEEAVCVGRKCLGSWLIGLSWPKRLLGHMWITLHLPGTAGDHLFAA